jgi:hypothetical protein
MVKKSKVNRRTVCTRRVETTARDKNADTVEVRANGKWVGVPRWLFDTWFEPDNKPDRQGN